VPADSAQPLLLIPYHLVSSFSTSTSPVYFRSFLLFFCLLQQFALVPILYIEPAILPRLCEFSWQVLQQYMALVSEIYVGSISSCKFILLYTYIQKWGPCSKAAQETTVVNRSSSKSTLRKQIATENKRIGKSRLENTGKPKEKKTPNKQKPCLSVLNEN